ncbi:MAG: hypothetical protein J6Y70_01560 [Bacilli bacterium]|nr:hypothetical protein [Bacilli bacterium]
MIKTFKGTSVNDILLEAKKELGDNFYYVVSSPKDAKECFLETYYLEDVAEYGKKYLQDGIRSLNIDAEVNFVIDNENKSINFAIESDRNSILIGGNGKTLKAFSILLRLSISNKFKRKFRIFLDIGYYKNKQFSHIINLARKSARAAVEKRFDIKLDHMTSEARRVVHTALKDFNGISTESVGDNENERYIILRYTGQNKSDELVHDYKEVTNSVNNDKNNKKYYKNEFQRYSDNSFNNFYNDNNKKSPKHSSYSTEGINIFTNLSFLNKDSSEDANKQDKIDTNSSNSNDSNDAK